MSAWCPDCIRAGLTCGQQASQVFLDLTVRSGSVPGGLVGVL